MNSKKFLTLFLLLLCLFTVARAADEDDVPDIDDTEEKDSDGKESSAAAAKEPEKTTTVAPPVKTTVAPTPTPVKVTTTVPPVQKTTQAPKPQPTVVQKTTTQVPVKPQPTPSPKPVQNTNTVTSTNKTNTPVNTNTTTNKVPVQAQNTSNATTTTNKAAAGAAAATAASAASAGAAGAAAGATGATGATGAAASGAMPGALPGAPGAPGAAGAQNPIVPNNNQAQTARTANNINNTANVSDSNGSKSEGGSAIKTTLISLVAVGAVVGVATVGVRVYNKKVENRGLDIADIEAQPINNDFGKSNNELSGMPTSMPSPDELNPFNIMNDVPNKPYMINSPYEYAPKDNIDTTPFNKVETTQDNFMARESIFSNPANNIPQISNDVFNFKDGSKLPYVQELPVENTYIEEPVANQIEIENSMPSSQMPTLVPVQPEIVITNPEDEQTQGYKQIVPNVAQMKIVNTPDFNNMTTSMIEDHINNMELENLANTETQQQDPDTGYKEIIPNIQEAVIENFDVDDEEEDQTTVDNITDTYRAALRATYCSTGSDENRFSYKTVDSDHSLLHTMRGEGGEW